MWILGLKGLKKCIAICLVNLNLDIRVFKKCEHYVTAHSYLQQLG